jgi:hypothetical protein
VAGSGLVRSFGRGEIDPASLAGRARERRWQMLLALVPDLARLRVLDIGGSAGMWRSAPVLPAAVTVLNLALPKGDLPAAVTWVVGDACRPPSEVSGAMRGGGYDLVVSNSLLEHVGGPGPRATVAAIVRAAAPRYWVQTPYRYFPVEPHWLVPGFQHLPLETRAWIARHWRLGHRWTVPKDVRGSVELALGVDLVSRTEMAYLFPDAQVLFERYAGLPKSLVAVRA